MTTSLPSTRSYFQGSSYMASANSSAVRGRPWSASPSWRVVCPVAIILASWERGGFDRSAGLLVLGDLRLAGLVEQALHQALGRLSLGLGLEVGRDPVAEDGDGDLADVVERDA